MPQTGIITGTAPAARRVRGHASGDERRTATASARFKIVSGDTLALTPPMGWNHWYAHYDRITDKLMREAADVMVAQRHGRRGLPVREHRRLLDERAAKHARPAARRPAARRRRATSCRTSTSPT